jgi:hypothetical protein
MMSQSMVTVQLCRGHEHNHDRDLGLGLGLYQPTRRLLRWWRLGLGREVLQFVCEGRWESAPFYRPEGGGGAVALINPARRARRDKMLRCVFAETPPLLRANNFCHKVGDG